MQEAAGIVHETANNFGGYKALFHGMNGVDYAILILIGFSILMGIIRGFVREAMSLVTWVAAIAIAFVYFEQVSTWLTMINMQGLRMIIAFVLLLLSVLILGGILSYLIGRLIKFTGFGVTDRLMGVIFGLARGIAVVAAVLMVAAPTPFSKDPLWVSSAMIPRFVPFSMWMKEKIPEDIVKKIQIEKII